MARAAESASLLSVMAASTWSISALVISRLGLDSPRTRVAKFFFCESVFRPASPSVAFSLVIWAALINLQSS